MVGRTISDAATQAAFADRSHLDRWFRRSFGITPGRIAKPQPLRES
jgi:AraC-like DNA-binding protein